MLIWILAALCAYFIKGVSGFADALVLSSIVSFSEPTVCITPVTLLLSLPSNLILVWRGRRLIRPRICLPAIALSLAGSTAGIFFLKIGNAGLIKRFFGLAVLLISLDLLLQEKRPGRRALPRAAIGGIGVLSGLLSGLFGIGALMSAYISRVTPDVRAFKANLCAVFLAEAVYRILLYAILGILNTEALVRAALLLPVMLLSLWLGMRCSGKLPDRTVRRTVIALLMLSGLLLIAGR